ncbi:MAG: 2-oxoglutarate and iron-dependent oxygenase domain-containing protein [Planctomycetota bacterium]
MSENHAIPVLDARDLESPSGDLLRELARGFGEFGLVYISHHGIDQDELDALYRGFRSFLRRPRVEKEAFGRDDIWFQRGWTPPNTEKAVIAEGRPDFKECWFAIVEKPDSRLQLEYPELFADNLWPEDGDDFREPYLSVGKSLQDLGLRFLAAAAQALDLPIDTFAKIVKGGAHVTRALEYQPLDDEAIASEILWGEEHTDFNLITLLPGGRFYNPADELSPRPEDGSGLHLRTRSNEEHPQGRMVPGTPPAGCLVLQVGQELEILTGGLFQATPHVVTAPKAAGWSRVSVAHFVHVHPHHVLFPLEEFCNENTVQRYRPPVLAGTYAMKTMVDIGLAPPETLSAFGYRHYDRLASVRSQS